VLSATEKAIKSAKEDEYLLFFGLKKASKQVKKNKLTRSCEGESQSVGRNNLRRRKNSQISNVRQNVQNLFDG